MSSHLNAKPTTRHILDAVKKRATRPSRPRPCLSTRHTRPHLGYNHEADLHFCKRCGKIYRWNSSTRVFHLLTHES